MEEIPYYFKAINRLGFVVKPQKPFFDWLKYFYPEMDFSSPIKDYNFYLIREMDSNEEAMEWLEDNFDQIFSNELLDWNTNESIWPQNRTWKVFKEWFDVDICSMILDMEDDEIEKE